MAEPGGDGGEAHDQGQWDGDNPIRDPLTIVLELMQALAISVLKEHSEEVGQCVVCGLDWPCEPVVIATHDLAVI